MSARSFVINVINRTHTPFSQLNDSFMAHGVWRVLPMVVDPESTAVFWAVSSGVGTGVEGRVTIREGDRGINIKFNNPFVGSNEFRADNFGGAVYRLRWGDPGGDDAYIDLVIDHHPEPEPSGLPPLAAEGAPVTGPEIESIPKAVLE